MSGREQGDGLLTEAQWDLLADYLGGVLDGTPEHAAVAELIRTDSEWAAAHTALADATDAVLDDLHAFGATPITPMPADLAARLDAALAEAAVDETEDTVDPDSVEVRPPLRVVADDGTLRAPRRRRIPRWAAPAAVAAGVVAFAAVGFTGVFGPGGEQFASSSDAGAPAAGQAGPPGADLPEIALAPMGAQQVQVSGRDYTPATAQNVARQVAAAGARAAQSQFPARTQAQEDAAGGADQPDPTEDSQLSSKAITSELVRLSDSAALQACLDAIAAQHGVGTTAVQLVDYASFNGAPGLVVFFTDATDVTYVWVSGPECGTEGMGADTRYSSPVG